MTIRQTTMMPTELMKVDARRVTIKVNGVSRSISWTDLRDAAQPRTHRGVPVDPDALSETYSRHLADACRRLRGLPLRDQGLYIDVFTRTGGATWSYGVYDASGAYRGDLMRADEGCDEPRERLAVLAAEEIQRRLGCAAPIRRGTIG